MPGRAVGRGHVRHYQPGAEHRGCLLQVGQATRSGGLGVGEDYIHSKRRRVPGEDLQVLVWRKSLGLPRLRRQVEDDQPPGHGAVQRGGELGHQQVRQHAGEPRARAEHHPVGVEHRAHRLGHRGRVGRQQRDRPHLARRAGACRLPADRADLLGPAGSAPTTSATMSSGTAAIGSTRPPVPSSLPTQSRPATVSPSRSHSATMSRLPTAWPASSRSPPNRCCTTLLQVVPHSSSPHSAASAIRRSPGGRTPKSRRSRPLDPPSSATVTIAVSSPVTRRSADRDAASPCPPPSATALGPVPKCSLPP